MHICGRLFSARSFCEFREFRGRISEGGVGMAGMPYPPKCALWEDTPWGKKQRGHGGMPCPLMSLFCGCTVCLVGAAETAAPPKNSATCLVGALLALASGKAERRQVHPLKDYLTSTFLTLPSAVRTMFRPFWNLESLTPSTVKNCASPLAAWMPLIAVSEFSL